MLDAVVARIDDPQPVLAVVVIPVGSLNWPLPDPAIPPLHSAVQVSSFAPPSFTPQPNASSKVPSGEYSSTRLAFGQVTHTLPCESTRGCARPRRPGPNCLICRRLSRELLHVAVAVVAHPQVAAGVDRDAVRALGGSPICPTYSPPVVNSSRRLFPASATQISRPECDTGQRFAVKIVAPNSPGPGPVSPARQSCCRSRAFRRRPSRPNRRRARIRPWRELIDAVVRAICDPRVAGRVHGHTLWAAELACAGARFAEGALEDGRERFVGERVGRGRRAGASFSGHGDVDRAGPRRRRWR